MTLSNADLDGKGSFEKTCWPVSWSIMVSKKSSFSISESEKSESSSKFSNLYESVSLQFLYLMPLENWF